MRRDALSLIVTDDGKALSRCIANGPLWAADGAVNRKTLEQLCDGLSYLFPAGGMESAEARAIRLIPIIDALHNEFSFRETPYTELTLVGLPELSSAVQRAMEAAGFDTFSESHGDIVAKKSTLKWTLDAKRVGFIVDRAYGEKIRVAAQKMPLWVIDSLLNRPAFDDSYNGKSTIVFDQFPQRSAGEVVRQMIDQVDLHEASCLIRDPPYSELLVIGAKIDEVGDLSYFRDEFGFVSFEPTSEGFLARKAIVPTEDNCDSSRPRADTPKIFPFKSTDAVARNTERLTLMLESEYTREMFDIMQRNPVWAPSYTGGGEYAFPHGYDGYSYVFSGGGLELPVKACKRILPILNALHGDGSYRTPPYRELEILGLPAPEPSVEELLRTIGLDETELTGRGLLARKPVRG